MTDFLYYGGAIISYFSLIFKIVISINVTLYPRFLLTFSKNKYNTKFYNEEFLRVVNLKLMNIFTLSIGIILILIYSEKIYKV